jgi:hypothetical protein
MGENTRLYNRFEFWSVADCDCRYCLYWKNSGCTLKTCRYEDIKQEARRRENLRNGAVYGCDEGANREGEGG